MPHYQPLTIPSSATPKQLEDILKYASEIRKFEIERFWHRSLFFWGFIAAAFVAFSALYDKDETAAFLVSCFGFVCTFAWTLQNRGSKYWQEAWEQKVQAVEQMALGANLFSNLEPTQNKGFWGAKHFSVSQIAIVLSDFTALVWVGLVITIIPKAFEARPVFCTLVGVTTYAFILILRTREPE